MAICSTRFVLSKGRYDQNLLLLSLMLLILQTLPCPLHCGDEQSLLFSPAAFSKGRRCWAAPWAPAAPFRESWSSSRARFSSHSCTKRMTQHSRLITSMASLLMGEETGYKGGLLAPCRNQLMLNVPYPDHHWTNMNEFKNLSLLCARGNRHL